MTGGRARDDGMSQGASPDDSTTDTSAGLRGKGRCLRVALDRSVSAGSTDGARLPT